MGRRRHAVVGVKLRLGDLPRHGVTSGVFARGAGFWRAGLESSKRNQVIVDRRRPTPRRRRIVLMLANNGRAEERRPVSVINSPHRFRLGFVLDQFDKLIVISKIVIPCWALRFLDHDFPPLNKGGDALAIMALAMFSVGFCPVRAERKTTICFDPFGMSISHKTSNVFTAIGFELDHRPAKCRTCPAPSE